MFLVALGTASSPATVAPFTLQSNTGLPNSPHTFVSSSAAWGDYDNDGKLDLLVFNGQTAPTLWHNNPSGSFHQVPLTSSGGPFCIVSWADFDNDGYLDIAIFGLGFFHNERNGTFQQIAYPALPSLATQIYTPQAIAWTDYDHDGRLDFFYASMTPDVRHAILQLWRNLGNNTFALVTNAQFTISGAATMSVACADMDNDGWEDVLLTTFTPEGNLNVELWRNNGGARGRPPFTQVLPSPIVIANGGYPDFSVLDYDNDGRLDVLYTGDGIVHLAHNLGGNLFQQLVVPSYGNQAGERNAWGDFDNDGRFDFVCDGIMTVTNGVYHNDGSGNFSLQRIPVWPDSHATFNGHRGQVAIGDFDNDGRLDFILAAYETNQLFRNVTTRSNTPPTIPSGLTAVGGNSSVRLSWTRSTDAETPSVALTYAVRVGTAPGRADVVCPPADLATGRRRLPQRGPIQTPFYTLTNLASGTYYWSVQAIDSAFAGSGFAPEGTFQFTYVPPGLDLAVGLSYAVNVTINSAVLRGWCLPGDTPAYASFEWGASSAYGNTTPWQMLPAASAMRPFQMVVNGLQPNQLYHLRAVVTNDYSRLNTADSSFYTDGTVLLGDINGDGRLDANEAASSLSSYFAGCQVVMTNPALLGGGAFQLGIGNLPAWPFRVQASSDLLTWTNLPGGGQTLFNFLDPTGTNSTHRYYRLR